MGNVIDGPKALRRLDQLISVRALSLSNPAKPFNWTVGKNAALATPMLAFADAMRRSAAEMSGLRSSNAEGKPGGIKGGAVERARSETRNVEAGWPASNARACSDCARWSVTAGNCASVVFSTVCA